MAVNFPNIIDTRILKNAIDNSFEWAVVNFGRDLELAFLPLLKLINAVEQACLQRLGTLQSL